MVNNFGLYKKLFLIFVLLMILIFILGDFYQMISGKKMETMSYKYQDGLKVYVPQKLLTVNPKSGFLFGRKTSRSITVTGIIHLPITVMSLDQLLTYFNTCTHRSTRKQLKEGDHWLTTQLWDVIGIWLNSESGNHTIENRDCLDVIRQHVRSEKNSAKNIYGSEQWLVIKKTTEERPSVYLSEVGSINISPVQRQVLMIMYDTSALLLSCILDASESNQKLQSNSDVVQLKETLQEYCTLKLAWNSNSESRQLNDFVESKFRLRTKSKTRTSSSSRLNNKRSFLGIIVQILTWCSTGQQIVNRISQLKLFYSESRTLRYESCTRVCQFAKQHLLCNI